MVEPLEETRSELTFATEPVMSSLELATPGAGKLASLVELDEVEVRAPHFSLFLDITERSPIRSRKVFCKSAKASYSSILLRNSSIPIFAPRVSSSIAQFVFTASSLCASHSPFQGDWKISGLGLTIPLLQPNGSPTRWEFPTFDGRVPSYIQRSFDYAGALFFF